MMQFESNNNSFQDEKIELTAAYLIYSPPQHDIYSRPYQSSAGAKEYNDLIIATNGGTSFSYEALNGVASNILYPSYSPDQKINISNGMNEARFAFFLEITIESIYGKEREIIKGYTNYLGITNTGTLDPNMELYFNDRILISEMSKISAAGGYTDRKLRHNFKILSTDTNQFPDAVSMRPQDIISYQQTEIARYSEFPFIDTRVMLGDQPQQANAMHNLSNYYLSDMITGYTNSSAMMHAGHKVSDQQFREKAYENTKTPTLMFSKFYNKISKNKASYDNKISLSELNVIWPRSREFWVTALPSPNAQFLDPLQHTTHWHGANCETQLATSLSQVMPALMTDLMLKSLTLTMSNMTLGNRALVKVLNYAELFEGTINTATLNYIVGQVEIQVVKGLLLSRPDIMAFDIQMDIHLLSNSTVHISLNGGDKVPYNVPTFCNSLNSPMLGTSISQLDNVTNFIGDIVDNLVTENANKRFNKGIIQQNDTLNINPIASLLNNSTPSY